jgi:mRNA-degrading endonuclease RelE of RelBE toxin-antitoxin system
MPYKILVSTIFQKHFKALYKKYPSLKEDFKKLLNTLETNPTLGTPLGKDCYKIRLQIKSKSTGKSGGARIITHIQFVKEEVRLLDIYDKSDLGGLTDKELIILLKKF